MTQTELANKLFVTEKAVSRWETGRGTPDISLLIPLSKELNIDVSELLNGEENIIEKVFVSSSIPSDIIQLKYDDKVELYNIKEKKVVVTLDKNVTFNSYNDLYINVTENGVNNFYSYINGKKFYSK